MSTVAPSTTPLDPCLAPIAEVSVLPVAFSDEDDVSPERLEQIRRADAAALLEILQTEPDHLPPE